MPPDIEATRGWLKKADEDRRALKTLLEDVPPNLAPAAFHAQQAAEKLLKAFLTANNQKFEKIHDLEHLLSLCSGFDASFAELRDDVEPLTAYAIRFRYPGPAEPTVEQVSSAQLVIERLRSFVIGRLPLEAVE